MPQGRHENGNHQHRLQSRCLASSGAHRSGGDRGDSRDKFDAGIVATQNRIDSGKFTGAGAQFNPGNTGLKLLDPEG